MDAGGQLQGADEMIKALAQVEENVGRKHVRTALRAGAKVIARELVATAESPDLAAAVKVRAGKRSRTGMSMVVTLSRPIEGGAAGGGGTWLGFYNFGHRIGKRLKRAAAVVLTKLGLRKSDVGLSDSRGKVTGSHWADQGFENAAPMARQVVSETLLQGLNEEIANSGALKPRGGTA